MLFNSLKFLVFFPLVFLLYWALPHRARKYLLLAASYYFYMCWKPEFIVLILYSTAVDYLCALGMERRAEQKKLFLAVSLTMNLGLLFFFKYFNFFGATLTALCRAVSIPFSAPVLSIILPVGISFYTFQTLSYTIDVYRGRMKAERDFVLFALFVSYFPQLVAGPIERAADLLPQLREAHSFRYEQGAHGARLMAWGFFKKCVCAAYLGALADRVYGDVGAFGGGAAAFATAAFALQIYCDFGGYSDIARGCSELLGVELTVNFKRPYFARSMRDFWRRWHISLTGWFREYVYIPLGGNRRGRGRTALLTLVTFLLSGLWHGAGWTFVVWGGINGCYLVLESLLPHNGADKARAWAVEALRMLKTFALACFAWVFFRADTMADAVTLLRAAVTGLAHPRAYLRDAYYLLRSNGEWAALFTVFSVAVLLGVDALDEKTDAMEAVGRLRPIVRYPLYAVFLVGMVLLIPKHASAPFIYFQF